MELLKEIFHTQNLNLRGKSVFRQAVRGIILDGSQILMVYSTRNGDYKFPGGGVKRGETNEQALVREVKEETGATVTFIVCPFGEMIEYDRPIDHRYDVFKMTSTYFVCTINGKLTAQKLDQYEEDLGFLPVWIDVDAAIQANKILMASPDHKLPRWTPRDTFVLETVRAQLLVKSEPG